MSLEMVCAWCSESMGSSGIGQGDKPRLSISHGICPNCARELKKEAESVPQQNLETSISNPALRGAGFRPTGKMAKIGLS